MIGGRSLMLVLVLAGCGAGEHAGLGLPDAPPEPDASADAKDKPGSPSCRALAPCGSVSCCTADLVPGGEFLMGRSYAGSNAADDGQAHEQPEHRALLQAFRLDRFEVTVGRFREFLEAGTPTLGEQTANQLRREIACDAEYQTFSDLPGTNEEKPINCVSWAAANAFCLWDGGRLPSEAEWERAAAGGEQSRLYPWGQDEPTAAHDRFGCLHAAALACSADDIGRVHGQPAGAGRWGHFGLAGNVMEHVLDTYGADWYARVGMCRDCVNLADGPLRVRRGGNFRTGPSTLRSAHRYYDLPDAIDTSTGFRCAYNVADVSR